MLDIGEAYDPPSLTDGSSATTTVTATGVAVGDFITSVVFSRDLQGIDLTAWVSAADTVSVKLSNRTGGTIDLEIGAIYLRLLKR